MPRPTLTDLNALAAIATHRSFRKSADALGVSPSTLSHMMRTLESRLGVRLLNRTTRSVSPTEAGARLIARLEPLLKELDDVLDEVNAARDSPVGRLRINTSDTAARLLLRTVVPTFLARCPDMVVDLVTDGRLVDIVAGGFDAGVRFGESVPQDMVAVRLGGDVRFVAIASPDYVARRGVPQTPDDLLRHPCIRIRMPSGKSYRWEFAKHGQTLVVDVRGSLVLDHVGLMVDAAVAGLGIAYVPDNAADAEFREGRLVTLLDDWCPAIPGLFIYYPRNRQMPAGLRAFVDVVKETAP